MKSVLFRTATVLIAAGALTGCVRFHGPEDLRRDLSRTAGVELDREFGITITRGGVWLARKALKISEEEDIDLRGVKRVEIGVYEVRGLRRGFDERAALGLTDLPDWDPIVRIQEEDENVLVLINEKDEEIRSMVVVVAEDEEWVLVRIRGKLQQILEDAMRMAFTEGGKPELYERSREERGLEPLGAVVASADADPVSPHQGD